MILAEQVTLLSLIFCDARIYKRGDVKRHDIIGKWYSETREDFVVSNNEAKLSWSLKGMLNVIIYS